MSAESPIAHRTRGAGSYEEAAANGMCKICAARLPSMEDLWAHLRDDHLNDPVKRAKAMEAFPIAFQLDRLSDCLPTDALRSTPILHSRPMPCSLHGNSQVLESTKIDGRTDFCLILIEEDPMDPPLDELSNRVLVPDDKMLCKTAASPTNIDLNVARHMDSPPDMSHHLTEVLTVDRLISPLPIDMNVALSKSVSIQIEDEGEPLPPCTMVLQSDPHNRSMPRLLEVPSPSGEEMHIRIEQTPAVIVLAPSTSVDVCNVQDQSSASPPGTPRNDYGQSPPREQSSPSVLDIILKDDVSIQIEPDDIVIEIEPDLEDLTQEWKEKITGSPNKPAFPPPSYAKVAKTGANKTAAVAKLWNCDKCRKKFYTEKGLRSHSVSCSEKKEPSDTREQDTENVNREAQAVPKNKTKKSEKKAPVVKPTYCSHCNKKIFLSSTLEDHYMKKHFRRLSPQGSPSTDDKPEPPRRPVQEVPRLPYHLPPKGEGLRKPIHPRGRLPPLASRAMMLGLPPPARSTVDSKVATGKNPPLLNTLETKVRGETPPPPDPTPVNNERKGLQTERSILKRFVCDLRAADCNSRGPR
ncbi:hypothetical protein TNCV_3382851 [Trichonephila clavipes]|nr:hypothetical protein TNCV_3382851 [Trichonephila clavipes]